MTLPEDFINSMIAILGKEEYSKLEAALHDTPPTSIRINPSKVDATAVDTYKQTSDTMSPVPWCSTGFYLSQRPQFTFDPLLHAGCYYVQEASSMYVGHILSQYVRGGSPVRVLDLCAAPGGKSTLALSHLPEGSLLIANEAIRSRANILAENIIKWGKPNCIVTNNYAEDFTAFDETFDIIICDVPCSGEGMFRKDHDTIGEWSIPNVKVCSSRQRDIVSKIWHTLKQDGILIYSTCTYNTIEDEDNVRWIAEELGAEILSSSPDVQWGIDNIFTHFYPHITKGEGFFVSVLRKKAEEEGRDDSPTCSRMYHGRNMQCEISVSPAFSSKKSKRNKQKDKAGSIQKTSTFPSELKTWVNDSTDMTFYQDDDTFKAFPSAHYPTLQTARQTLKVVHSGISLAKQKGKNLQPCHSLSMSLSINRQAFPCADLDLHRAIAYLSGEAIQLPQETPTGHVLLTYQGHPIGFANNIGSRANNLYPSEWKIRSSYRPQ